MDRRQRETGLVALQAAVLARRIFLPATRRSELGPEHWQILMAIALTDPVAAAESPSGSAESLAAQLSLDRDQVHGLLFSLHARGYLAAVEDEEAEVHGLLFSLHARGYLAAVEDEEAEGEMPRFVLSAKGRAAVDRYVERAARFLPGWPPVRVS